MAGSPARRIVLRLAMFLVPTVAFVGLLASGLAGQGPPAIGEPAPRFEAELLDGNGTFDLASAQGKPVLINFWASWCIPCKEEGPLLSDANERYGDDVLFVGVNIRDAVSDARAFAAEYDLAYTHVRDPELVIYDDYGLTGQPESFVLDERGRVLEHIPGPWSEEALLAMLESLVAR